jgi:hypothetical protein
MSYVTVDVGGPSSMEVTVAGPVPSHTRVVGEHEVQEHGITQVRRRTDGHLHAACVVRANHRQLDRLHRPTISERKLEHTIEHWLSTPIRVLHQGHYIRRRARDPARPRADELGLTSTPLFKVMAERLVPETILLQSQVVGLTRHPDRSRLRPDHAARKARIPRRHEDQDTSGGRRHRSGVMIKPSNHASVYPRRAATSTIPTSTHRFPATTAQSALSWQPIEGATHCKQMR